MDSLSQMALGAAVTVAVMGRHHPVLRAAAWGAVVGTLPDLDALIDHGDPVRNMTLHRAETHALFWLLLATPLITVAINALQRDFSRYRRWCLAVGLTLLTHPLLDAMTVYGTRLALAFTDTPYGVGSIFIIDPLYTLPLLVAVVVAVRAPPARARRVAIWGLTLSSAYLVWGVVAQQQVRAVALASLDAQGLAYERLLVTPTAFNSVLWRVVAVGPETYHEGFRSLLDRPATMDFDAFPRGMAHYPGLQNHDPVQRLAAFSHGFFDLVEDEGRLLIRDLRMGQAPNFYFSFAVANAGPEGLAPQAPLAVGERPPLGPGLRWMGPRLLGTPGAPPR
jgi:inner membrane protein